jgi:hypothetical protein
MKNLLDKVNFLNLKLNSLQLVKENNFCYLYTQGIQRMTYECKTKKQIKEFLLEYKSAYGTCVLSGLGMGFLTNILLEKKEVKKVVVYETNKDVIELNEILGLKNQKLTIINEDINNISNIKCDCLFLDHYEDENYNFIINSIKKIHSKVESKLFWIWNVPGIIFNYSYENLENVYNKFKKDNNFLNMPNLNEFDLKKYLFEAYLIDVGTHTEKQGRK